MLDLSKPVHDLCAEYPEVLTIMQRMGFADIAKPGMLATAGRFMTIPKGVAMKKLDLGQIIQQLKNNGFAVKGGGIHE